MKKFYLLTKTLLVAALLMVGANAWAQETTTLLEYGTGDVAWTNAKVAEWTAGGSPTLADGVVTITGGNGSYATSKTITPTSGTIINVTAVWRGRSNTGRAFSAGNGSYFRFGNIIVAQNDQDQRHGYGFAGLSNIASVTTFSAGSYRVDIASCTWLKIEMEINTATDELTSFSVKSEDGTTTYASASKIALTSADYTTVAFGYQKGGGVSTTNTEQLKSIKITETTQPVSYANYTVHFKDNNGTTVKVDEVRNGEVGATVNANSADKTTFYDGDYKYVYANDGDGVEVTNDGLAEFTVTYTKYGQYTYNVYAVNSSSEKLQEDPIATATTYEGETATLAWSKYIKIGGTWYSTSESSFAATATEAGSRNVVYTPADITYFFEVENLTASRGSQVQATGASYSGNIAQRHYGASGRTSYYYTTALEGGKYSISIPVTMVNASPTTLSLRTRTAGGDVSDVIVEQSFSTNKTYTFDDFEIPDGSSFVIYSANEYNSNALMDYVTLTLTDVPVTVSPAGFATYVPSYDLDFTGKTIEAYTVKVNKQGVATLTKVNEVPAGTPVLLYKEGGATEYIPVMTGAAAVGDNDLVAGTGAAVATDDGDYTNMILNNVSGIGFYFAAGQTVDTNRAYLHIATSLAPDTEGPGAHGMRMVFAGDITGTDAVEAAPVAAAKKNGAYLENGQVVYYKNDMKFNAAGARIY